MGDILRSLDQLGPAMAETQKRQHREFIDLFGKLKTMCNDKPAGGICGTAQFKAFIDPNQIGKLPPVYAERLPVCLKRIKAKIKFIEEGGDHMRFRLKRRDPSKAGVPSMTTVEEAVALLFRLLMAEVKAISTRRLLGNTDLTDDEQITVDLVRALIARYPALDGTDD